ncbi:hypothetical protein LIER_35301 [Lithospermum erythrorhizon]|uniref:Uncharacterized protein n=1 Tax=Lithospermum erythrorhizon TaxID=34254 RepID=A0AAV3NPZ6_LITER
MTDEDPSIQKLYKLRVVKIKKIEAFSQKNPSSSTQLPPDLTPILIDINPSNKKKINAVPIPDSRKKSKVDIQDILTLTVAY